jgi:hypothetical protein
MPVHDSYLDVAPLRGDRDTEREGRVLPRLQLRSTSREGQRTSS